jgi:hypothetical protein
MTHVSLKQHERAYLYSLLTEYNIAVQTGQSTTEVALRICQALGNLLNKYNHLLHKYAVTKPKLEV